MQGKLPVRKHPRLEGYDYSQNGAYFVAMCVKGREELLGTVVGRGILDAPYVALSKYGKILEATIEFMNNKKNGICIHKYVIMPNHAHLIVAICDLQDGASGKRRPTNKTIPKFISSIKRFANKQTGLNMWQTSYWKWRQKTPENHWNGD